MCIRHHTLNIVYTVFVVTVVDEHCIVCFQGEWKLVALSAPYRLKRPDRRFEELKNYSAELQTHINNIVKIRTVSTSICILMFIHLHYYSMMVLNCKRVACKCRADNNY